MPINPAFYSISILQNESSFSAFTHPQIQALAFIFIKLNSYALNVFLVFFGSWCFITGYLIFRTTFLPHTLGILLMISGLCWMMYLYPPVSTILFFPYIVVASALREIPLEFWLMIKGVNVPGWNEQVKLS